MDTGRRLANDAKGLEAKRSRHQAMGRRASENYVLRLIVSHVCEFHEIRIGLVADVIRCQHRIVTRRVNEIEERTRRFGMNDQVRIERVLIVAHGRTVRIDEFDQFVLLVDVKHSLMAKKEFQADHVG